MSNFVESHTWQAIESALNALHPPGICIDVGIGDQDFYFEWFANLGYPTIAVDPVASDYVRLLCEQSKVKLHRVALGRGSGVAALHYSHHAQIRSLSTVWGNDSAVAVITISLPELWCELGEPPIAALKLDIEGTEPIILQQLYDVDELPAVLAFEIGGLYPFRKGKGRWNAEAMYELTEAIGLLWELGYEKAQVFLSGDRDYTLKLATGEMPDFPSDAAWGNMVFVRGANGRSVDPDPA